MFWILNGVALLSCLVLLYQLAQISRLKKTRPAEPARWPSASILKPLAGVDDDLLANLQSHLRLDYPGEWEILLGVRSVDDPAYAIALPFATKHFPRVKLHLQEGEPGLNPKVNQLITLTRHAKGEILAISDSGVRVHPNVLREHAAALAPQDVGLSSHPFVGVGEETLGSALDNMSIITLAIPATATAARWGMTQIIGKSMAVKRDALDQMGGWESVKNVLAEDQRFARQLKKAGLKSVICPSFVENVQRTQSVGDHFNRFARWAMIRFRVVPAVVLEPLLNPLLWSLSAALLFPSQTLSWVLAISTAAFSAWYTQTCAKASRGYGFAWHYLLCVPLRDLVLFATWLRGATMMTVSWRGNQLRVGKKTALYPVNATEEEEPVFDTN